MHLGQFLYFIQAKYILVSRYKKDDDEKIERHFSVAFHADSSLDLR
jgi:hypothetical protein